MDALTWLRIQWDRAAGWGLIAVATALVAAASTQAREAVYAADSLSFLMSGGFGGLALGALGCALLVSAGFHDEWRRLDRIETALSKPEGALRSVSSDGEGGDASPAVAKRNLRLWIHAEWDRLLAWTLVVAAFIWLLVGYRSLADSLYPAEQVAYLVSSGVGALFLLFIGAAALLFADWRDDHHKLSQIAGRQAAWRQSGRSVQTSETSLTGPGPMTVAVLLLLSAGVVALGWAKAADAVRLEAATDGLVVAAAGLGVALVVLGAVAIYLRVDLGRRMAALLPALVGGPGLGTTGAPPRAVDLDLSDLWTAEGLQRYHRSSCPALVPDHGQRRRVTRPADTDLEPCLLCDAGE